MFHIKGILDSLKLIESSPKWFVIGVTVNLAMLVFVVILKKKLFPYQNFFNSKKTNEGNPAEYDVHFYQTTSPWFNNNYWIQLELIAKAVSRG
jgi:hypothetical protein